MFESRMYFVDHLMAMGANIIQCDPHRVVVIGPTRLRGSMLTSPDIRAGMAMLIAACCAEGESVIKNAQVIDRGYEAIEDRLVITSYSMHYTKLYDGEPLMPETVIQIKTTTQITGMGHNKRNP